MMSFKNNLLGIFTFLLIALFGVSCQKSEDKSTKSPEPQKAQPAPAATAAPAKQAAAGGKDGAALYKKLTCFACHGNDGKGMYMKSGKMMPGFEAYPTLAGQNSEYLFNQIKDIMAGVRNNGQTKAMIGIKSMLDQQATDDDLRAITKYLEGVQ